MKKKTPDFAKLRLGNFKQVLSGLTEPKILAASEAQGLAWLSPNLQKQVFDACYSILLDRDKQPSAQAFKRRGVTPMRMQAVLMGLKAWHRITTLVPDPETTEDLLSVQDALLKPSGRGPKWSILVGLKIAALYLKSARGGRLNLICPPMGEPVRKGFETALRIKLKENDQDYYLGLAIQTHLARLAGSNIMDINTGLHVTGRES